MATAQECATATTTTTTTVSYITVGGAEEATKPNRGRKSKSKKTQSKSNKKPQRGMGVEQLEKLRLEEIWKTMPEIIPPLDNSSLPTRTQTQTQNQTHHPSSSSASQSHHHHHHLPLFSSEPIPSVPVFHGASKYGVPIYGGPTLLGLGSMNNNVLNSNNQVVLMDPNNNNRVRVADPMGFRAVQVAGRWTFVDTSGSNELSSIPNHPPHFSSFKKKRYNNIEENAVDFKDKIYGLYQENNFNNGGVGGGGITNGYHVPRTTSARSAFHDATTSHNNILNDQSVEVLAIHRNGNSMGKSAFMEYEFFPRKDCKSTSPSTKDEFGFPDGGGGEASYNNYFRAAASSTSVDLSLKL